MQTIVVICKCVVNFTITADKLQTLILSWI